MSVRGAGVDIVNINRIRRMLSRYPQRLPRRILHADELHDYQRSVDKPSFLARRFAAKEAVAKALGLGLASGAYASRICIAHNRRGAPQAQLPAELLPAPDCRLWLSLSDERDYSIAYALCEDSASL